MDPNSTPATATNATDSSVIAVSSLVSSLGQLEMSASPGPIDLLPNELMQQILAKLAWEGDANKLIRLRLVSKRWSALVEDCCQKKKSLFVNCDRGTKRDDDLAFPTQVTVYSNRVDSLGTILKLFLNTEKLIISDWTDARSDDTTQRLSIAGHLNSLSSLKQLQLCNDAIPALPHMAATLSRLEHLSLDGSLDLLTQVEVSQFVGHLGPRCVRIYFGRSQELENAKLVLDVGSVNWHRINAPWLANLTHLQMTIYYENKYLDQFVHHLGQYATLLESLDLAFCVRHFKVTLPVLGDLAKLAHLNELKLEGIALDIALLDQAATQHRLPTLPTVLTCDFFLFDCQELVNADSFTRVLSALFPNVTELKFEISYTCDRDRQHLRKIGRYLGRFPKLRKHKIVYN